jgi:hypothetical protein
MEAVMRFGEILEAAEKLQLEEQETLVDILRRRITERRQEELVREIRAARKEFQAGRCSPATVDELMTEILA